jgi:hypothetical protein
MTKHHTVHAYIHILHDHGRVYYKQVAMGTVLIEYTGELIREVFVNRTVQQCSQA